MAYRKLNVAGDIYLYTIGRTATKIKPPIGKTVVVGHDKMTGMSWTELERAEWKGYWPEISPKTIRGYIERHGV